MGGEGFSRARRLRKRRDFLRVQRRGRKLHVRNFLVFVHEGGPRFGDAEFSLRARLGVTVTRKVGGAVVRNRIKRLVREVFRRSASDLRPGLVMVWVAKHCARSVSYSDVEADFKSLREHRGLVMGGGGLP